MLEILTLTLGPVRTNCYLLADPASGDAAVIDPAWDGALILEEARRRGWRIAHLWYTHAHFDHIGGAGALADGLNPLPLVALHPADHALWRAEGGAPLYGFRIDPGPEPTIDLFDGQLLQLGSARIQVFHTPGHTPGHSIFYLPANPGSSTPGLCFCGDLIFENSVGRTDLPGGDADALANSIRTRVYTLPRDTRLLPGHGRPTTVDHERQHNPFVSESPLE